jgi:DNA invertase Pin-like site-specific DNA recombinase
MAARARGRKGGRPKAIASKQLSITPDLYEKYHPIAEICRTLKISKATLYWSLTPKKDGGSLTKW